MSRVITTCFLCGVGAALLLCILYLHHRNVEVLKTGEKIESIRNVRLLHSLANQELLQIRYQLYSNYDQLADYTKQLRTHLVIMETMLDPIIVGRTQEIDDHYAILRQQVDIKLELQDRFKSANAMMKNSLLRLREIAKKLSKYVNPPQREILGIEYFSQLSTESLQYGLVNKRHLEGKLGQILDALGLIKQNDRTLNAYYRELQQHAELIRSRGEIAKDSLSTILAIPIERSTEHLQHQYSELHGRLSEETNIVRNGLYSASFLLLLYAIFAFIRLAQRKQALAREKERAQITLQSIGDGIISTDAHGIVQFINPVAEQLTKWQSDEAKGKQLHEIFRVFNAITNAKVDGIIQRCITEKRHIVSAGQSILVNRANEPVAIEDSVAPIMDADNEVVGTIIVFRDVSDKRELSQQLLRQASHDALTGVINRRGFDQELVNLIENSRHEGLLHALLYIDLDQFKVINDTCGHDAGDHLLISVTELFQDQLPHQSTLARLGGDEFGILLHNHTVHEANVFAEQLLSRIKEFRFEWQGINFQVGASIGLASIHRQVGNASLVLSAADMACYVAKDLGRNRVHIFNPSDRELVRRQGEMEWVAKLTAAYKENRFTLYCQAIIPIGVNTSVKERKHYELLVRLRDTGGRLVSPNSFIPAAERYNFMPTIDRWVIHRAFSQFRWFNSENCYSINLSGTSLNSDTLVAYIKEEMDKSSLSPEQVCFEVTETAAIANLDAAATMIKELKKLGFKFALDDFGQGLSSYSYLNNLPVDYLKIDGEFVRNVKTDPVSFEIVSSVNKISHLLGMQTIAEYVENESILEVLREIGIDYAQGFQFGLPEPMQKEASPSFSAIHRLPALAEPA